MELTIESNLIQVTTQRIRIIQQRMKVAQSCQKSYVDTRRRHLEFDVGVSFFPCRPVFFPSFTTHLPFLLSSFLPTYFFLFLSHFKWSCAVHIIFHPTPLSLSFLLVLVCFPTNPNTFSFPLLLIFQPCHTAVSPPLYISFNFFLSFCIQPSINL